MTTQIVDPTTPLDGRKEAVFVAVVAWTKLYEGYEDPGMTEEYKNTLFPVVLMNFRWDGKLGFIGGFVEKDMTHHDTILKELVEESGMFPPVRITFEHVVSHQNEKLRVHLYWVSMGTTTNDQMRRLFGDSVPYATHFLSEGTPIWAHLADYGKEKGFQNLLKNNLAMGVGEELEKLYELVQKNAPEGSKM